MSHVTIHEASNKFLKQETAFHLGEMLTEQSHPVTRHLSQTLAGDTASGIEMLLRVDDDIPPVARRLVESNVFQRLRDDIFETLRSGNRVYFSGCGATGHLAILLDAAYRRFCAKYAEAVPTRKNFFTRLAEQTFSVMTGGDPDRTATAERHSGGRPGFSCRSRPAGVAARFDDPFGDQAGPE